MRVEMSQSAAVLLLLVEDQDMLRIGLKISIERLGLYKVVGEATNGHEAILEALRLCPDVILMDIGLPGIDGIEATRRIKKELSSTRIVMLTSHSDQEDITAALRAGAEGFCSKDTSVKQIAQAIDAVMAGEVWLDPTAAQAVANEAKNNHSLSVMEVQILSLLQSGASNNQIAQRLEIPPQKLAVSMRSIIDRFSGKREQVCYAKEEESPKTTGEKN